MQVFFYCLFISVLSLEIHLSEMGKAVIPLTGLTLPQFCACPMTCIPEPYCVCGGGVQWLEAISICSFFVCIGGIVNHFCLNFIFITSR
jgi:hypothetical protein